MLLLLLLWAGAVTLDLEFVAFVYIVYILHLAVSVHLKRQLVNVKFGGSSSLSAAALNKMRRPALDSQFLAFLVSPPLGCIHSEATQCARSRSSL